MTEYPRRVEQGVVGTSPGVAARQGRFAGSEMRSPRAFLGSIAILLALPLAVLTQVVFGGGSGIVIHFALAVGSVLVGLSAFDFETPRWLAWMGCVSAIAFAAIFLLQNASALVGNDSFSHFTNEVLGLWGEKALLTLLTIWLVAVVLTASRGTVRILGFVVMALVVCVDLYVDLSLLFLGTNPFLETPAVKLAISCLSFGSSSRAGREPRQG